LREKNKQLDLRKTRRSQNVSLVPGNTFRGT
jgi:hypothetical protein